AGIRWGLSADLRAPYGLDRFEENTWRSGLDRILLGVAAAEGDVLLGARLPLDDIGSASVDLAGRIAEMVDRLERCVLTLRSARTVPEWVDALRVGVRSLGAVERGETWQDAQLDRELDAMEAEATAVAGSDGYSGELRLADVRALLEQRLRPRPTRANFRTGNLTVCTMVPMRSVPHRVVCLVGLDDGVFPRSTVADGDDVLQRDPVTGERDLRSEDRQLLLDAVLAVRETLVMTHTGASVTTNQDRPPSVPLDELLDALETMAPGARAHVVRRHPLQPFDPRCFDPQAPFSFDARYAEAARALQGERRRPTPFLVRPLLAPRSEEGDVALADLQAYFRHPVGGFLRQGLDVTTPQEQDEPADAMPLALAGLEEWAVGDRILRRIIDLADPEAVLAAELHRGDLPPRGLGERAIHDVCVKVQELATASASDREEEPTTVDITVDLGNGRRLTGVVPDVRGSRIVRVSYSKLAPKHRLAAWVDLLALSAAHPERLWTAATYGWFKRYSKQGAATSLLGPVDDRALTLLRELVDVRDRGLREPLPLFMKASAAWARAVAKGDDGFGAAHDAWRGSDQVPGEREDAAHVRVFGQGAQLERILGQPRDDEDWNAEPTRAGRYAVHLWAPLLAAEKGKNL
ncbi:MAG: exodeoxyribonuclease gamma subunit, partial [Nocardioidaceae bacterium]|nr:exodeoxyribonuclease gamma subunit [Nocardioidaceae bacterium]